MCTVTDNQTVAVWSLVLCRVSKIWISVIVRPSVCVWFGLFSPNIKGSLSSKTNPPSLFSTFEMFWYWFDIKIAVMALMLVLPGRWKRKEQKELVWSRRVKVVYGWVYDGVTAGRGRCEKSRGSAAFAPPADWSSSPHFLLEQPQTPSRKERRLEPFWAWRVLIKDPLPRGSEEAVQTSCDLLEQPLK